MIVLDASVVVELLTNGALANSIGRTDFVVPHLIDVEVVSAASGNCATTSRRTTQFLCFGRVMTY